MSDLSSRFQKNIDRNSLPIKRLFIDQLSTSKKSSKERSHQPLKSLSKVKAKKDVKPFTFSKQNFIKKYLNKQSLKKQLKFYNRQILLIMFRKIFFIMVGIIFFNIFVTSADQKIILCNMFLSLMIIDIPLGYDILGSKIIRTIILILRILAYSINYYLLFLKIYGKYEEFLNIQHNQIIILQLNAVMNLIILNLFQPIINLNEIKNMKQPYMSLFSKIKSEIAMFLKSFLALYHIGRLILLPNLLFFLLTIIYIMKRQQQIIFENIFNLKFFKSIILTTFLLYCLLYFINKINDKISIQLLSTNKKQINLSLLRLECQNQNNEDIHSEIIKYIWKNCQSFWDTQFLSHNYIINYDVLQDYLINQLKKLIEVLNQANNSYKKIEKNNNGTNIQEKIFSAFKNLYIQIKQIYILISVSKKIKEKEKLFFIIEQINYFQQISTISPLNIYELSKLLKKIDDCLCELISNIHYNQLRIGFQTFYQFMHSNIKYD